MQVRLKFNIKELIGNLIFKIYTLEVFAYIILVWLLSQMKNMQIYRDGNIRETVREYRRRFLTLKTPFQKLFNNMYKKLMSWS